MANNIIYVQSGASLTAAKDSAQSGDTIVVGPGSYQVTGNLLKNGVNWFFFPGASIVQVSSGTPGRSLLSDVEGPVVCTIGGSADFKTNPIADVITIENPGSHVILSANSIWQANALSAAGAINHTDGTLIVTVADFIRSERYDCYFNSNAGPLTSTFKIIVVAKRMISSGEGVELTDVPAFGTAIFDVESMEGLPGGETNLVVGENGIVRCKYFDPGMSGVLFGKGVMDIGTIKLPEGRTRPLNATAGGSDFNLKNCTVISSTTSPIFQFSPQSGTPTLTDCTLVSPDGAAESINTTTTGAVRVEGILRVNKAVHPSVNVSGIVQRTDLNQFTMPLALPLIPRTDHTTLVNGMNHDVNLGGGSFVKIKPGPTAPFTITGISGGINGRILILYNSTSERMTLAKDSASSTPANRIDTLTSSDFSSPGPGSVVLIYDGDSNRWILTAVRS